MVARRLRAAERADHIAFLDRGRTAEQRTYDDLLRAQGRYADFWAVTTAG